MPREAKPSLRKAIQYERRVGMKIGAFLRLALVSIVSGLLAACTGYDYRPLSMAKAPDCNEAPGEVSGTDYWLKGTSGPWINWSGCDKTGTNLQGKNLSAANLKGTNLAGADLSTSDLGGAFLSGANLRDANLSGANIYGTYFEDADLSGANLTGLRLSKTRLWNTKLNGATWSDGATICAGDSPGACE